MIRILSLAFVAALAAAPAALAADKTVRVTFAGGQTSKEIKSTIKGDRGVNYMLKVGAGQRFSTTTKKSLVAGLRRILAPEYRTRAGELAPRITKPADSAAAAADLLENFAGGQLR